MSSTPIFQTEIGIDHRGLRKKRPQKLEDEAYTFDASATRPLPVNIDAILDSVLADLATVSTESREPCAALLHSRTSKRITEDAFWWVFNAVLGDEQDRSADIQAQLFDRIADNYVRMMLLNKPANCPQQFLDTYWDTLAQCIYRAYVAAYPKSHARFGNDFKKRLIDVFAEWCTGLVPSKPNAEHWPADPAPQGSSSSMGVGHGSLASSFGALEAGGADAASAQPRSWVRSVSSSHRLSFSPLVSQFLAHNRTEREVTCQLALTHNPSRPLVPRSYVAPRGRRLTTVRSQAVAVAAAQKRRSGILHEYQANRERTLRNIAALRKDLVAQQALARTKARMVIRGDVQEYSNYLTSLHDDSS
eukprot:g558.t1